MSTTAETPDHWDMGLLILALGGMALCFAAAAGLLALLLLSIALGEAGSVWSVAGLAITSVALGCLGFPGLYIGGRAVLSHQSARPFAFGPAPLWPPILVAFSASLGVGYLLIDRAGTPTLLGAIPQILAAAMPVLLVLWLVLRPGTAVSPRRILGGLLAGSWLVPAAAVTLEGLMLVPLLLVLTIGMALSPETQKLLGQILVAPDLTPTMDERELASIVLQPWLLLPIGGFLSVVAPLIEEAAKTMAIWPLLKRSPSSGEAFQVGAICGAGYALFEALFQSQSGGLGWTASMLGRGGTTLMHAFMAGVTCWWLARSAAGGRWLSALGAYMFAVLIHGLWNSIVLGISVVELASSVGLPALPAQVVQTLGLVGTSLLATMATLSLLGIHMLARRLPHASHAAPKP